jgi:phosphatidylserine decarboxylase
VRIAREALPFAAPAGLIAVAAAPFSLWVSVAGLSLLAFTLFFFRDPERIAPADPAAVLSPADGRVVVASATRVSIFLSLTDVHICRSPVGGRVGSVVSVPGRFLAAFKSEASEQNERTSIELDTDRGRFIFTLVAGLVARRIVCKVSPGRQVAAGERVGLIRFGSRVDVDLPVESQVLVRLGDRVIGGQTVIARLG